MGVVRLEREDGTPATQALWAVLSEDEAMLLIEALDYFIRDEPRDPGWHHHIGQGDCELTITVEASSDVENGA
jgi:hypothetical protein